MINKIITIIIISVFKNLKTKSINKVLKFIIITIYYIIINIQIFNAPADATKEL
jgi:hypothetical protein